MRWIHFLWLVLSAILIVAGVSRAIADTIKWPIVDTITWRGLTLETVTLEMAAEKKLAAAPGVLVIAVKAGSRADKAGLKVGDVLVAVGGDTFSNTTQFKA